jgi:hypothetical protein
MNGYSLLIAIGATLGLWRVHDAAPQEQRNEYVNAGLLVQFMMLVGARLGYVAVHWNAYRDMPERIFKVSEGGLSLWGAVLGALAGYGLVLFTSERNPLQVADVLLPLTGPMAVCAWLGTWLHGYGTANHSLLSNQLHLHLAAAVCLLLAFAWLDIRQPFNGIVGMQACAGLIFLAVLTGYFLLRLDHAGPGWGMLHLDQWACLTLLIAGMGGLMAITVREYRRG